MASTPNSKKTAAQTQAAPRAVVVGGNRTPFGKVGGHYRELSNLDMLQSALDGLVARYGLQDEKIDEVAGGAVLKHSKDFNLTREAVLGSRLDPRTPAFDLQRACATGVEAVTALANKIRLGQIESGIAAGVDSTSDAPIVVTEGLRRILLEANHARTTGARLKALAKVRPSMLKPVAPGVDEPRTGLSMGEHQAITAQEWGITREAQDQLAYDSHQNLAAAYDQGFFDDLITPLRGLTRDAALRPDTSLEKLGKLNPVFGKRLDGEATMTAGNSTPLSDGASTVLIATEQWAAERNLQPLAVVVDSASAAVDFVSGKDGLLMAPAYAVPELLGRNGLTLDDIDFVEIHEAFAATVLSILAAWESEEFGREKLGLDGAFGTVDRAKLNVHGSSLAAGHPFGATGGRLVAATAKMVAQRAAETGKKTRALISVCAAGGLGGALLLESI